MSVGPKIKVDYGAKIRVLETRIRDLTKKIESLEKTVERLSTDHYGHMRSSHSRVIG